MIVLDGKKLAEAKKETLRSAVNACAYVPQLAIVQVGDNPASDVYVAKKAAFGKEIGVTVQVIKLPNETTTDTVTAVIADLNKQTTIQGIIIQLPVPAHIDKNVVVNAIDPDKDVDGLTAVNMWKLMDDNSGIVPATARGISALLTEYSIDLEGAHVVIVGDSLLVGKSSAMHFLNQKATVTVCHDKTKDLAVLTKQADILMVAVGKPGLISNFHVRPGQVVIDIGITRTESGDVVGDVDFDSVKDIVAALTPVPGGVGPMTVVSLFENLLRDIQ
jgi:methylenetetrahydrofolate dehydrogenase (NADP+) / methenyltetrahydrofolate cyclohydrolase